MGSGQLSHFQHRRPQAAAGLLRHGERVSLAALAVEVTPTARPHSAAIPQVDDTTSPSLLALFLIVITVFSYLPTFSNGFVNYDDNEYVSDNSHIQPGLTVANV